MFSNQEEDEEMEGEGQKGKGWKKENVLNMYQLAGAQVI